MKFDPGNLVIFFHFFKVNTLILTWQKFDQNLLSSF